MLLLQLLSRNPVVSRAHASVQTLLLLLSKVQTLLQISCLLVYAAAATLVFAVVSDCRAAASAAVKKSCC